MSELTELCRQASRLRERDLPYLLATVVGVDGSAYRRPGARMLVAEERWMAGSVSGGCLERDVLLRGAHRTRDGAPVVVTYDSTGDDDELRWGLGLGCNGIVRVLLEQVSPNAELDPLRFIEDCFEAELPGVLVTVTASRDADVPVGARLAVRGGCVVASTVPPGDSHDELAEVALATLGPPPAKSFIHEASFVTALVERIVPPVRLFVLGTRHDALALVRLARAMRLAVTVADTTANRWTRARFSAADASVMVADAVSIARAVDAHARAAVVVMTHDYERDRALLGALLRTDAFYVGVLGPKARTERMLSELSFARSEVHARLHAPVGLDLGAETPEEIGLSIMAELQATLAHASARPLRERRGAIHAPLEDAAE